jgi:hypothetical protein
MFQSTLTAFKDGHATGAQENFLTGFVTPDGQVWDRPVGVAVRKDGSLLVTDDGSRKVWRVACVGDGRTRKEPAADLPRIGDSSTRRPSIDLSLFAQGVHPEALKPDEASRRATRCRG